MSNWVNKLELDVGDWIVITGDKYWEEYEDQYSEGFGLPFKKRNERDAYSGIPLEILGIGLPFLSIKELGDEDVSYAALDTRKWEIVKVPLSFVQSMMREQRIDTLNGPLEQIDVPKVEYSKLCPICDCDLIERLNPKTRKWKLVCEECNFEGAINNA